MNSGRRNFLRAISSAAVASDALFGGDGNFPRLRHTRAGAGSAEFNVLAVREEFPVLSQKINGRPLVYLDSAATTQRPRAVIEATVDYYRNENANPSASLHTLARRSAARYEGAREMVARFVNACSPREIVFTRGTTEAINLVATSWGGANLHPGDEILLTATEHYSNLLPWQFAAERAGARLRFLDIDDSGRLRLDQLNSLLRPRTRLMAFTHVSNVLGGINPAKEICEKAHCAGALVLIDAAQSVPHFPVDVQELGCDFLAFSSHKMLGPMGVGVLWARREILESMPPYQSGGNMAHDVEMQKTPKRFAEGGLRFEAGTPNVAGAVGLAAAVQFLESHGRAELWKREQELTKHALAQFREVEGLRILGPTQSKERISVFSYVLENSATLDLVRGLDEQGIAVRAGELAALPLLKRLGVPAALRASCYVYTRTSEIDALVSALKASRVSRKAN